MVRASRAARTPGLSLDPRRRRACSASLRVAPWSRASTRAPGFARRAAARATSRIISTSHASVGHIASPARAGASSFAAHNASPMRSHAVARSTSGNSTNACPPSPVPTASIKRSSLDMSSTAAGDASSTATTASEHLNAIARSSSSSRRRRHSTSPYAARATAIGVENRTIITTSPTLTMSPLPSVRGSGDDLAVQSGAVVAAEVGDAQNAFVISGERRVLPRDRRMLHAESASGARPITVKPACGS